MVAELPAQTGAAVTVESVGFGETIKVTVLPVRTVSQPLLVAILVSVTTTPFDAMESGGVGKLKVPCAVEVPETL
jgi:hypothetical protein